MFMTRSYVYKDEIVTFSDEQAEKWNQHVSVEIDKQLKNALGCGNQQKIKKDCVGNDRFVSLSGTTVELSG